MHVLLHARISYVTKLQHLHDQISDDVIEYVAWPTDIQRAISCSLIGTSTGGTRLVTTDGCAWVELASHGQTLTTCHLARLPHERDVGRERESVEDRMATLGLSDHKAEKVRNSLVPRHSP